MISDVRYNSQEESNNNINDSLSLEDISNKEGKKINLEINPRPNIKEVYEDNFIEEIKNISELIEDGFNVIGMDTEFPGTVFTPKNYNKKNFYYKTIKVNIDSLKLIQLGITLKNKKGEFSSKYKYHTWQFNFKYDISKEKYCPKSFRLLENAGIDFEKLKKFGINHNKFAEYLITSGLVLNPETSWVCFQGAYDFGYLLKLLINEPLPETEIEFIKLLNIYFPNYYDIRVMTKDICCLQGSLNKLAKRLKIERARGEAHQAGSDSYITITILYLLIIREIITKELMKEKKNILYGIGKGEDNEAIIKYMKMDINENNIIKDNNICEKKDENNNTNNELENYNNYNIINKPIINFNLVNMNMNMTMNDYCLSFLNSNLYYYYCNSNIINVPSKLVTNPKLSNV